MRKSHSSRPSRATDAVEILNQLMRTLEEDVQPRIAELRAAIEARRRQEQRDRVPNKGKEKPAVSRGRKSNRNARRSRRP